MLYTHSGLSQVGITLPKVFPFMPSSMTLLFYYLAPLQNDTVLTSQCIHFNFWDKGEANCLIRECPTCGGKRRDK